MQPPVSPALPANGRVVRRRGLSALIFLLTLAAAGCGGSRDAFLPASSFTVSGTVVGALQPLAGARVVLYAAEAGQSPVELATATTSASGAFSMDARQTCPSPGALLYLLSTGGTSGMTTLPNPGRVLMSALGSCENLPANVTATVNEVSTVASAWPLAPFADAAGQIVPQTTDAPAFRSAMGRTAELFSVADGAARISQPNSTPILSEPQINSLANVLAGCVQTGGGGAGDGSSCGDLYSIAAKAGAAAPTSTLQAAFALAKGSSQDSAAVYALAARTPFFSPALTAAPLASSSAAPTQASASAETGATAGETSSVDVPSGSSATAEGSAAPLRARAAAVSATPLTANTITITDGGTYSGNWVSTDPAVPAVTIKTDAPVILENSTVVGRGHLIVVTGKKAANLTVRNVTGLALDPQVAGKARGAFVVAYIMDSLVVQNCTMTGVSFGVKTGFSTPSTLRISNNKAIDMEDRASDGQGGFQTRRPQLGHFALLYQTNASSGAEIAWNQVVQTVGQSSVDDVISIYNSAGTATAPINVHDNYMEGYSSPATTNYAAAALMSAGESANSVGNSFVQFNNNQAVHTAGTGVSIGYGHDITAQGNRVVSCGQDSSGNWFSHAGVYAISLSNRVSGAPFYNNTISTTAGGLLIPNASQQPVPSDSFASSTDLATASNSVSGNQFTDPCLVSGAVNLRAEDDERTFWSGKLASNKQTVGDQHSLVTLSPQTATVQVKASQQFTGIANGQTTGDVTWSISPAVGSISTSGLYTAPDSVQSEQAVTVTATSVANPSLSSNAQVTVLPVNVSVAAASKLVQTGQSTQLTATVTNATNTDVTWSLSPAVGSISAAGVYTAPASASSQQVVTVTATSVLDTRRSGSVQLSVGSAAIALWPLSTSLYAGQTQAYTASLPSGISATVAWSISPATGSITSDGTYTAPSSITSQQTVTVTGGYQGTDGYKYSTARIMLLPPVKVNLVNGYFSITEGQTAQFEAKVQNASDTSVRWSISPSTGSISTSGLYTPPSTIASQQTVTVTATSVADPSKSISGSVVLNPPVKVTVVPGSVALSPSATQQFTANVAWSSNKSVTWTISPSLGSISSAGLYTAPSDTTTPTNVTVTATSAADPTRTATAIVTLNPPLTISVSPSASTLSVSQTQLFTATVNYNSNTAVTWSISPNVGSIATNGRYTAPSTAVTSPQTVTVTATSAADTSKTASATVTINPPVAVSVSPASTSLYASQSQQLTATVNWTANTAVTWSISPNVGSISSKGVYTAPASITDQQTVTVTAASAADNTRYGTARITLLPPVKVNLASSYFAITEGGSAQFTASVQNAADTSVKWSISPSVGSISSTGLYTPPSTISSQQTITVTATSTADPSSSASGSVVLNPPTRVSVVPGSVALSPSATQQFTANVAWNSNTAVTWSISPKLGSISSTGLYTAPSGTTTPTSVTVTATSVADTTKSSSAAITLNPPVTIAVSPSASTLTVSQTQLFTATLNYTSNTAVTWSISPNVGSIATNGRYTAPSTPVTAPQAVTVTATSAADTTKTASATITVNPPVAIVASPSTSTLYASQTQQMTAEVNWTSNSGVTWSISPSVGSISAKGLYTAPDSVTSVQTVTVTAISSADPTKYSNVSVTLLPPVKVNLTDHYFSITVGQTAQLNSAVQNASDATVSWSLSSPVGSITSSGLYSAPSAIPAQQTITATATSVADPTKSDSATIVLNPPTSIAMVPSAVTLTTKHTQQFTANIAWNNNTAVTWTMSPSVGTLSSSGLYTAPATIDTNQTVTITATSVADSSKSASAVVSLLSLIGPAPITITEGGTYSGNWVSNDPSIAAVTVATDQPVIIENSTVQSRGHLILVTGTKGANVTVRNVTGTGLDPQVSGKGRGAFIRASVVSNLSVTNSTMKGTSFGVLVISSPSLQSLSVLRNKANDLEDRASDGNGGFLTSRPSLGHFLQLSNVVAPAGAEIGWNQVVQTMGSTSTEDIFNMYKAQGAAGYPIVVHDNYMEGFSSVAVANYTGNGMITDGDAQTFSAYITFDSNHVVHSAGGGVAIASGHDVTAHGNRIVSCGVDANGAIFTRTNTSAIYLGDYYGAANFYNNVITGSLGGFVAPTSQGILVASNIYANPADLANTSNSVAGNQFTDPCFVNGSIRIAAEDDERTVWANKLSANNIVLGDSH